ncbi:hypothetical protein ACLOJK_002510 [Asimina triloba]
MADSGGPKNRRELRIHDSLDELATELADFISVLSEMSVKERGFFAIALSGGSLISLMRYALFLIFSPLTSFNYGLRLSSFAESENSVKCHTIKLLIGQDGMYFGSMNVLWQRITVTVITSLPRMAFFQRVRLDYNGPRLLDLRGNGCNNRESGGSLNFLFSYLERPDSLLWVPQCDIVRFGADQPTPHLNISLFDITVQKHLKDFFNEEGKSDVPVLPSHVHSINDSLSAEDAASEYEFVLRQLVKTRTVSVSETSDCPKFDLILLGMGPDGHVASLFPQHAALGEQDSWVTFITDSPKPPPERITFTLPVINSASHVAIVATGSSKAEAVRAAISDVGCVLPVQMVRPTSKKLRMSNKDGLQKWVYKESSWWLCAPFRDVDVGKKVFILEIKEERYQVIGMFLPPSLPPSFFFKVFVLEFLNGLENLTVLINVNLRLLRNDPEPRR